MCKNLLKKEKNQGGLEFAKYFINIFFQVQMITHLGCVLIKIKHFPLNESNNSIFFTTEAKSTPSYDNPWARSCGVLILVWTVFTNSYSPSQITVFVKLQFHLSSLTFIYSSIIPHKVAFVFPFIKISEFFCFKHLLNTELIFP